MTTGMTLNEAMELAIRTLRSRADECREQFSEAADMHENAADLLENGKIVDGTFPGVDRDNNEGTYLVREKYYYEIRLCPIGRHFLPGKVSRLQSTKQ